MAINERARRLAAVLRTAGFDAVVLRLPENVLYATGYWPVIGPSVAVITSEGSVGLVHPEEEADYAEDADVEIQDSYRLLPLDRAPDPLAAAISGAGGLLRKLRLASATIGYEGGFEQVATNSVGAKAIVPSEGWFRGLTDAYPSVSFRDATAAIFQSRAMKTPSEVAALRLAVEIASFGMEAARLRLRPGMTEAALAAAVEGAIQERGIGYKGASRVRGYAFVHSGERGGIAGRPFNVTGDRVIQGGDLVLIELDTYVDGYFSDLTRSYCVGAPSDYDWRLYEAVREAHTAGFSALRDGVPAKDVDGVVRTILEEHELADRFTHHTGHGLGVNFHEPPSLHPSSRDILRKGMVVTIEPGVFISGYGGIRIEDDFLITDTGAENLFPYTTSDWGNR